VAGVVPPAASLPAQAARSAAPASHATTRRTAIR
jgi:hypothetical protein